MLALVLRFQHHSNVTVAITFKTTFAFEPNALRLCLPQLQIYSSLLHTSFYNTLSKNGRFFRSFFGDFLNF